MSPYGPQVPLTAGSPTALTANTSTRFTFAGEVLHITIVNNSAVAIGDWAVNGVAVPGGWSIPAGGAIIWDQGHIQTVDILSTAATPVNSGSSGAIMLRGWA